MYNLLIENVDADLFISGVCIQADTIRDNRLYPKEILHRECVKFNQEKIAEIQGDRRIKL